MDKVILSHEMVGEILPLHSTRTAYMYIYMCKLIAKCVRLIIVQVQRALVGP